MKINNFMIVLVTSVIVYTSSCANENTTTKSSHDHTEVVEQKGISKKMNKYENELGHALDKNGNFITGCPSHKEMIGIEGDQCPKCGYMTMLPITWSLEGIDTIRVTSLPDYKPLVKKQ